MNLHALDISMKMGAVMLSLGEDGATHQIMEDIGSKFPNAIKNYTYFSVIKTHKTYGF